MMERISTFEFSQDMGGCLEREHVDGGPLKLPGNVVRDGIALVLISWGF